MSQNYKVFQLVNYFVSKYGYFNFNVKGLMKDDEIFIASTENKDYQVIRITTSSIYRLDNEVDRIEQFNEVIKNQFGLLKVKCLDIHISNDDIDCTYPFDVALLDTNYHSGKELSMYPGVYEVIHDVKDENNEIQKNIISINEAVKRFREKASKRPLLKKIKDLKCPITLTIIGICILMYIATIIFSRKYSLSATLILLGGDYKIFTLGLHEFYRLITYAFLHSSMIHLLCNMIAFYSVSRICERLLGGVKYIIMLLTGILFGSILNGALSENGLLVGMSGGIYTLFTYFILHFVSEGFINVKTFIPTILINLMLNFMPGVSWMCHLGGLIAGIMFYYIYKDYKINKNIIIVLLILLSCTTFKYVYDNNLKPYYGQTDFEMLSIYNDLGMTSHATNIYSKLTGIYYGGN